MNQISDKTRKILKDNGWDSKSYKLFQEEYFLSLRKKYDKSIMKDIPDSYIRKLSVFNQMKLKIQESKKILSFNIKSIKCYSNDDLVQLLQILDTKSIFWIGSYYTYELFIDENENLYGYDCMGYMVFYGKGIFKAIDNLLNDQAVKEWSIEEN